MNTSPANQSGSQRGGKSWNIPNTKQHTTARDYPSFVHVPTLGASLPSKQPFGTSQAVNCQNTSTLVPTQSPASGPPPPFSGASQAALAYVPAPFAAQIMTTATTGNIPATVATTYMLQQQYMYPSQMFWNQFQNPYYLQCQQTCQHLGQGLLPIQTDPRLMMIWPQVQ